MRGIMLRALPVCVLAFTTGCFMFQGQQAPTSATPPTETHAYWQKVGEIMARKPISAELKDMLKLVREQTDAWSELPTEGVDTDLVAAVEALIRCEEDVLRQAEFAGNDVETMKRSQGLAMGFASANKKATETKKRVRALRDTLNSRYGGGFPPIQGER
jgi:hypothetical protein